MKIKIEITFNDTFNLFLHILFYYKLTHVGTCRFCIVNILDTGCIFDKNNLNGYTGILEGASIEQLNTYWPQRWML